MYFYEVRYKKSNWLVTGHYTTVIRTDGPIDSEGYMALVREFIKIKEKIGNKKFEIMEVKQITEHEYNQRNNS